MSINRGQYGEVGVGGFQTLEELARLLSQYLDDIFATTDWVIDNFEIKGLLAAHIAEDNAHPQYRRLDTEVPIEDLEGPFEEGEEPGPRSLFIREDKTWSIVTKEDIGLGKVLNEEQATRDDFDNHANDLSNPHQVTKSQVGLGNVDNIQQATKEEFNTHDQDLVRHTSQGDKDKLAGIEAGATRNSTDAQLRDRSTHTGTQSADTITGLGTAATSDLVQTGGQSETLIMSQKAVTDAITSGSIFSRGMILLWSGELLDIPAGWAICDGTNGTPNLTDRFIIGAGGNLSPGNTGGSSSVVTSSAGAHTHPISVTVNAHTLSASQTPSVTGEVTGAIDSSQGIFSSASGAFSVSGAVENPASKSSYRGTFYRSIKFNNGGSGGSHSHGASGSSSSAGAHTHTVNTLPPYYALALIMKL